MKTEVHPKYGPATVSCACGNVIPTRSTKESIQVDVCSACHPFFTGKQKLLDTAGRIDKFKKKYAGKIVTGAKKKKNTAPAPKTSPKSEA